jgi:hypothetical protein
LALPAAFREAYYEVYQDIFPWAVQLRQQVNAFMHPVPLGAYALARRTGPGIGLGFVQHVRPVILPGHMLKHALSAKMPCNKVIMVALEHLRTASASSQDIQLH